MRRKIDPKAERLRSFPSLKNLSDRELEAVVKLVAEAAVDAGHVLTREGTLGRETFLIIEGSAAVTGGGEHLGDLGPGDMVGEMSLIDGAPRSATVTATTPMRLFVLGVTEFDSFARFPRVNAGIMRGLTQRLRAADRHTVERSS